MGVDDPSSEGIKAPRRPSQWRAGQTVIVRKLNRGEVELASSRHPDGPVMP
jgi:hypothetical protein